VKWGMVEWLWNLNDLFIYPLFSFFIWLGSKSCLIDGTRKMYEIVLGLTCLVMNSVNYA
jgi:hypothetical protein